MEQLQNSYLVTKTWVFRFSHSHGISDPWVGDEEISLILQIRKLSLKENLGLAQGHTAVNRRQGLMTEWNLMGTETLTTWHVEKTPSPRGVDLSLPLQWAKVTWKWNSQQAAPIWKSVVLPSCRGLSGGSPRYAYLEPVNVTSFGKKVFAYVIKLKIWRWVHPRLSGWAPNPVTNVLVRDRREDRLKVEAYVKTEAEAGAMQSQTARSWKRLTPSTFTQTPIRYSKTKPLEGINRYTQTLEFKLHAIQWGCTSQCGVKANHKRIYTAWFHLWKL